MNYTKNDFEKIYKARRDKAAQWMKEHNIKAVIFEDSEDHRDCSVRYLSGHPSDASLLLFDDGKNILVPWDENLAQDKAYVQEIIPSTKFERRTINALVELLGSKDHVSSDTVAFSPDIFYNTFTEYREKLSDWNCTCKKNLVHDYVVECRAVKDEYEIECTKKACAITDEMTVAIIEGLKTGKIKTEMDVALFAERELRLKGAEKTSFDTLAAGPERSFAIHAFPGYTAGLWGQRGLSILDYGVCVDGYASDCTITIAKNPSVQQEKLLDLVELAVQECKKLYAGGKKIIDAVNKADEIFATTERIMPHGLGHGTGLEIHEAPFVSKRAGDTKEFIPGNIVTLEPGLYDKELGGVRLENDVLITKNGNEILTKSLIFRW